MSVEPRLSKMVNGHVAGSKLPRLIFVVDSHFPTRFAWRIDKVCNVSWNQSKRIASSKAV
jgi:hypothetical protein